MSQVNKETSKFVDNYDVTLDVCISSVLSQSRLLNLQVETFPNNSSMIKFQYSLGLITYVPHLLLLFPQHVTEKVDVCVEDETVNYLNRRDVQAALHARLVGVRRWAVCSE